MNDDEMRRAERQAREMQRWLARNPHAFDGFVAMQRMLQTLGEGVQRFVVEYSKSVNRVVHALGGLENIQAMVQMVGEALTRFVQALPPNWPRELDMIRAVELANDGFPVVWVPRGHVLIELAAAKDRKAQTAVLHAHVDELRIDLDRTLDEVTHPTLAGLGLQPMVIRRSTPCRIQRIDHDSMSSGYGDRVRVTALTVRSHCKTVFPTT